jgi:hypothetical protein
MGRVDLWVTQKGRSIAQSVAPPNPSQRSITTPYTGISVIAESVTPSIAPSGLERKVGASFAQKFTGYIDA